jgi:hypothetical protein
MRVSLRACVRYEPLHHLTACKTVHDASETGAYATVSLSPAPVDEFEAQIKVWHRRGGE